MERKRGQTVKSEARNVIRRLIKKVDEEAAMGYLLHPLKQASHRVSEYVGVSSRTISRIRKEDLISGKDETLVSPGKKRQKTVGTSFHFTKEDQKVIRDTIFEFYVEKKIVPTGPALLEAIREKIDFPWKKHTFRRLLHRMGYKWQKSNTIRKILIEKPSIVTWRAKYLKAIDYYRKHERNIIYIDETWLDNTLCFSKCWQNIDNEPIDIAKNKSSSVRIMIVHAGGKNGFVTDAALIFESRTTTNDCPDQMNATNFEKWLTKKLLPNIPANSVVVMDDAPYHSVQLNKSPSKYGKKDDMVKWLMENNIPYSQCMRKYELYELIQRNKKEEKTFKADEILKLHGHTVLRLPPHMCALNPIELAWEKLKRQIRERNTAILTSDELLEYAQEGIAKIDANDWHGFCNHVAKLEREYWRKDGLLEEIIDNMDLLVEIDDTDFDSDRSSSSEDFEN